MTGTKNIKGINKIHLKKIIERALIEDLGTGDITTENILNSKDTNNKKTVEAVITAKEKGVLAGSFIIEQAYNLITENSHEKYLSFSLNVSEGKNFEPGTSVINIKGPADIILTGERVSLNFLQRLSGIATKTRQVVEIVEPYGVKILDTRKTTPGLRELEKYAVRTGGGFNHRMGLYDGVMIKDNHIKAAGSIKNALEKIKHNIGPMSKISVEATNKEEAIEAYNHGSHHILLDNMKKEDISEIVALLDKKPVTLEVTGNVEEENIKELASTGVDYISSGSLTHSYSSIDFNMNF